MEQVCKGEEQLKISLPLFHYVLQKYRYWILRLIGKSSRSLTILKGTNHPVLDTSATLPRNWMLLVLR